MTSSDKNSTETESDSDSSKEEDVIATEPVAKKQKLSTSKNTLSEIEIKTLQLENKNLKQYVADLQKEKQQLKTQVVELEESVKKLQAEIESSNAVKSSSNANQEKQVEIIKQEDQKKTVSIKEVPNSSDVIIKKNILLCNKEVLQSDKNMSNNEPKTTYLKLSDLYNDSNVVNLELLKSNKILNVAKIEGTRDGWDFYLTIEKSAKPCFMTVNDFNSTHFKLNIDGHLIIQKRCAQFNKLMSRIDSCKLFELYIYGQDISWDDYFKLVSSKKVEICILEKTTIKNCDGTKCCIAEILEELPAIREFRCKFRNVQFQYHSTTGISKLKKFSQLQKFELLNLDWKFKLEDLAGFIKKNKKANFVLKFADLAYMKNQMNVHESEKKLMELIKFPCKLFIDYHGKSLFKSDDDDSDVITISD